MSKAVTPADEADQEKNRFLAEGICFNDRVAMIRLTEKTAKCPECDRLWTSHRVISIFPSLDKAK